MTRPMTTGEVAEARPRRVIGIDIGGTGLKVAVVRFDPDPTIEAGQVLADHAHEDPERAMDRLAEAARALCPDDVPGTIGVGCAGLVDGAAGVVHASPNLPAWRRVALGAGLAARLGRPIHLCNDAEGFLAAEWRLGAARGARHALFVTLGSGVGGGLVANGASYRGATGLGAEIGHMSIRCDGAECPCGNRGCLELYVGRHAIERAAREVGLAAEGCATPVDVAAWAARGEPRATALLAEAGRCLGIALAGAANLCEPEVIVIGGGVAEAGAPLLDPARAEFEARSMVARQRGIALRAAAFGPRAGIIGAALLAVEAEAGA